MTKAKFISNSYDKYEKNMYYKHYKYREYEYIVTVYICGYPLGESLKEQHTYEQAKIDRMIEEENKPIEPYTGECEKALNAFFEWCDN